MFSDDFDDSTNVRQPSPEFEIDIEENESGVARLIRAWTNERHSPDLLVFRGDLLDDLLQKLHQQAVMVENLAVDPSTTEEEHLRLTLVQMDMERLKFIVKSYVRARLYKIEKYAPFIMRRPEMQSRLSNVELIHAQRYQAILGLHFRTSVLDALPESTHALDQTFPDGSSMITEPNKDDAVFVHARVRCPDVRLPDGEQIALEKDSITMLRYRTVEQLLSRKQIELV